MNGVVMKKLGVGIVGFGRIGAEHAGWLGRCERIEARAVFDATEARCEIARKRGLRVCRDVRELLGDSGVDVVLVATPTAMHGKDVMGALAAGKHVMVEKPMGLDLAGSRAMVEEAERRGLVLSVFHCRRWDLDFLTVQSVVGSGRLGKVFNVESRLGQWGSCVGPAAKEWRPGWRNEAAFGGGGLYDWGSHFMDQVWRLMMPARPVRVFAQLRGNVWTSDCDDLARVCIDFDNGAVGLVEVNTTTTRPLARWHVDGTGGSVESPFSLEFDLKRWAELSFTPGGGGKSEMIPVAAGGVSEVQIWDEFAAAVWGDGMPAVSGVSVLPTMALLDAARESSQTGCAVALPGDLKWEL
jgi:scyllo-inositol 2-dehydrogenase (NADP+)